MLAADVTADGKLVALGGPRQNRQSLLGGRWQTALPAQASHTDWITAIEFSPDGTRLATGDRSGGIFLWESASGGTVGNLAEHKDSVTSLSWRGDSAAAGHRQRGRADHHLERGRRLPGGHHCQGASAQARARNVRNTAGRSAERAVHRRWPPGQRGPRFHHSRLGNGRQAESSQPNRPTPCSPR